MLAFLALLAAGHPAGALEHLDLGTAARRVAACGAGPAKVLSDPDLDTEKLALAANGVLSDDQVACIERVSGLYDVELPSSAQARFEELRRSRLSALARDTGRAWMQRHHLAGRLPPFRPGVDQDKVFARKIEALCHAPRVLTSSYGAHVLSPDYLRLRARSLVRLECVMNVAMASGFPLGFVGNETSAFSE